MNANSHTGSASVRLSTRRSSIRGMNANHHGRPNQKQVPINVRGSSRRAHSNSGFETPSGARSRCYWKPRFAHSYASQTRNGSFGNSRWSNSRKSGNTGIPPTGYSTQSGRYSVSSPSSGSGLGYDAR